MPYFLDIMLYLCQPVQSSDAGYDWTDLTPATVHYGCFPPSLLDEEVRSVERQVAANVELEQMLQAAGNAWARRGRLKRRSELYQKTRPKASKSSIRRAGSVKLNVIHPLLLNHITSEQKVVERVREDIHGYRPTSTVWEVERGKKSSEVMVRKRKMHQWSIERTKEEAKQEGGRGAGA